jgi:hypothetical protein
MASRSRATSASTCLRTLSSRSCSGCVYRIVDLLVRARCGGHEDGGMARRPASRDESLRDGYLRCDTTRLCDADGSYPSSLDHALKYERGVRQRGGR